MTLPSDAAEALRSIPGLKLASLKKREAIVRVVMEADEGGWQDIASAPRSGYIIGAWLDGSRWRFAQVFDAYDEWVDVFSDTVREPILWQPLPPFPEGYGPLPVMKMRVREDD